MPVRYGICPNCGSKARYRVIFHFLTMFLKNHTHSKIRILEIGPSKVMLDHIVPSPLFSNVEYTAIDLVVRKRVELRAPHKYKFMDICSMEFPAEHFDLIICTNVLPYIREYREALKEIRRCLHPTGILLSAVQMRKEWEHETAAESIARDPKKYTTEYVETNGSSWNFGQKFLAEMEQENLFSQKIRFEEFVSLSLLEQIGATRDAGFLFGAREKSNLTQIPQYNSNC